MEAEADRNGSSPSSLLTIIIIPKTWSRRARTRDDVPRPRREFPRRRRSRNRKRSLRLGPTISRIQKSLLLSARTERKVGRRTSRRLEMNGISFRGTVQYGFIHRVFRTIHYSTWERKNEPTPTWSDAVTLQIATFLQNQKQMPA
jgi:hypothetical protein